MNKGQGRQSLGPPFLPSPRFSSFGSPPPAHMRPPGHLGPARLMGGGHRPTRPPHLPPPRPHLPPPQRHLPPPQRHLAPHQRHLAPHQQHLPLQQPHLPPQQPHLPPQQPHLPPHQPHLPPQQPHLPPQQPHLPPQQPHLPPQQPHFPQQQPHFPQQQPHLPPQQPHFPQQQPHLPPQQPHLPLQQPHFPQQQPHLPPQQPHLPQPHMRGRPGPPVHPRRNNGIHQRPQHFVRGGPMPNYSPRKQFSKNTKNEKKKKLNNNKSDGEYYCEVCDRSWNSEELLKKHISEHVTCHIADCKYSAAPKMVTLHIKLQHNSGMYDKIIKSYNTEEINKWKEERRRNFPTVKNIEDKIAKKNEMEERGEWLTAENAPFKKGKAFSHKKGKNNRTKKRKNKRPVEQEKSEFLSKAPPQEVLSELVEVASEEPDRKISDDEWSVEEKLNKEVTANNGVSKVLMLLSSSYASDSEEEPQNDKHNDSSSDDAPTEECTSRKPDGLPNIHIEKMENRKIRLEKKSKAVERPNVIKPIVGEWKSPPKKKRRLTLLENLLADEIRQERNQILQCVRYIIKENYFES